MNDVESSLLSRLAHKGLPVYVGRVAGCPAVEVPWPADLDDALTMVAEVAKPEGYEPVLDLEADPGHRVVLLRQEGKR